MQFCSAHVHECAAYHSLPSPKCLVFSRLLALQCIWSCFSVACLSVSWHTSGLWQSCSTIDNYVAVASSKPWHSKDMNSLSLVFWADALPLYTYMFIVTCRCMYVTGAWELPPLGCICSCPWVPHAGREDVGTATVSCEWWQSTSQQCTCARYHHRLSGEICISTHASINLQKVAN